MTSPTPAQLLTAAADRVRDRATDRVSDEVAPHLEAWLRMAAADYKSREGLPKLGDPNPGMAPIDLTGSMGPSYWTIALAVAQAIAPDLAGTPSEAAYFGSPRARPRYRGISDPITLYVPSEEASAAARVQALHRMYLDWATSPDREHWVPGPLIELQMTSVHADFFYRNKQAVIASAHGKPVLDADEVARMDAP